MSIRTPLIVSLIIIGAMLGISVWGLMVLPPNAQIVVHWGIDYKPNLYLPKMLGLLLVPCIASILTLYLVVVPKIEPRKTNLAASHKLYVAGWYGSLVLLSAVHILLIMNAIGLPVDAPRSILYAAALFFILLGNFLGKSRSTFSTGVRSRWSLSSELAWEKSSRLIGRGLVVTGIVALLALTFVGTTAGVLVFAAGTVLSFTFGWIASYLYWKRDLHRNDGDSTSE